MGIALTAFIGSGTIVIPMIAAIALTMVPIITRRSVRAAVGTSNANP